MDSFKSGVKGLRSGRCDENFPELVVREGTSTGETWFWTCNTGVSCKCFNQFIESSM